MIGNAEEQNAFIISLILLQDLVHLKNSLSSVSDSNVFLWHNCHENEVTRGSHSEFSEN